MHDSTNATQLHRSCPRGTSWCTEHEHDADQCASAAITVTSGCSVWLRQELPGIEPTIVVDSVVDSITLDAASRLREAIEQLRQTAMAATPPAAAEQPNESSTCPVWCTLPAGHPVDRQLQDRMHQRDVARLTIEHGDPGQALVNTYAVQLEQYETLDGQAPRVWPPRIHVDDLGDAPLTGPQARQVAAALLDAADLWDATQAAKQR